MKKQIAIQDAVGKTLAGIDRDGDSVLFVWNEHEFSAINADNDYDVLSIDDLFIVPSSMGLSMVGRLVKLGIITQEEYDREIQARDADREKKTRRREYAEYLRLRAKFEPVPGVPDAIQAEIARAAAEKGFAN